MPCSDEVLRCINHFVIHLLVAIYHFEIALSISEKSIDALQNLAVSYAVKARVEYSFPVSAVPSSAKGTTSLNLHISSALSEQKRKPNVSAVTNLFARSHSAFQRAFTLDTKNVRVLVRVSNSLFWLN